MTATEQQIAKLLDQYCVWTDNQDLVQRVGYALRLMETAIDERANLEMQLDTFRRASRRLTVKEVEVLR